VKGDVFGSVEACCASVMEIGNNEVRPRILWSAAGHLTESDIEHAATSGCQIINFNNAIPSNIKRMAEDAGVKILDHNIIYRLTDDVKDILSSHLAPTISTRVLGEAEILQVFAINIRGRVYKNIAGCRVRNGQVTRNAKYRIIRNGEKQFEGNLI
jgi:translation initiation factor IF-2